jgi:hypothetical protein
MNTSKIVATACARAASRFFFESTTSSSYSSFPSVFPNLCNLKTQPSHSEAQRLRVDEGAFADHDFGREYYHEDFCDDFSGRDPLGMRDKKTPH